MCNVNTILSDTNIILFISQGFLKWFHLDFAFNYKKYRRKKIASNRRSNNQDLHIQIAVLENLDFLEEAGAGPGVGPVKINL